MPGGVLAGSSGSRDKHRQVGSSCQGYVWTPYHRPDAALHMRHVRGHGLVWCRVVGECHGVFIRLASLQDQSSRKKTCTEPCGSAGFRDDQAITVAH